MGSVCIIGYGWLGLPLGLHLKNLQYNVKGSTTSDHKIKQLKDLDLQPYLIKLSETEVIGPISDVLSETSTLIINIPPGLRSNPSRNYVKVIHNLIPNIEASDISHVIFISSTSVFNDTEGFDLITQSTLPNATSINGKQLIKSEQLLANNNNFKTTIIRFSGLIDNQRHPANFLSKKGLITNPEAPINLIHKQDCIGVITHILKHNISDVSFNVSYPLFQSRKSYYTHYFNTHNLTVPQFSNNIVSKGKRIDSAFVEETLGYQYLKKI